MWIIVKLSIIAILQMKIKKNKRKLSVRELRFFIFKYMHHFNNFHIFDTVHGNIGLGNVFDPFYLQFITDWIDTFDDMNLAWKAKIATNIQSFRNKRLNVQ
jgi:hypothetical protein